MVARKGHFVLILHLLQEQGEILPWVAAYPGGGAPEG